MKLSGVMPALVTPYDANGRIDFKAYEALLKHLRAAGCSGWTPNGSTGEYNAMTADERVEVLKFVADFANDDEFLIAGTNGGSTREVIEHTERAYDLGYRTVLLSAPYYAMPAEDELIKHYQAVLDAVDVNIVLYNYPPKVGVEVTFDVIDALADHPRVIGIKESSGLLQRAVDIYSRYNGRVQLVSGSDDIALDFMLWGADSWICGPANCMAKACVDLDRTYKSGDLDAAREKMVRLYKAMNSLETGKFVQKVKYGCELQGVPVGNCRAPLQPLSAEEKADFRAAMEPILNW
ncbi:dihydrodipicolinate synthase family protein [Aestuariispira ectoiniformans]|uniref:dihydrodipicolinate synthase family protein n=1 Tax=Aestuariispira ectoiniformans TaxID=2775080 RepID=UPI00223B5608|nr:dihydrodipicolinate synthase family protein [Aestuariispira ectoiniformans]